MRVLFGAALIATAAHADFTATVKQIGADLAKWNKGMMKSLQVNPDDTNTQCYKNTVAVNAEIEKLFDFSQYKTGTFDFFGMLDQYNVLMIKMSAAHEACSFKSYTIKVD